MRKGKFPERKGSAAIGRASQRTQPHVQLRERPRPEPRGPEPRGPEARGSKSGKQDQPVDRARPAGSGGSIWLFGSHACLAALANPARRVSRLLLTAETERSLEAKLKAAREARGAALPPVEQTARENIDRLLPRGSVHQGIALLAGPLEDLDLGDVLRRAALGPAASANQVLVVLDQVTDPHNVGAVLRSAAAFGALAVIVTERHSPEETGTLAKSASGALERVPLIRVPNLARALDEMKKEGFWCAGLAGEAEKTLAEAKLSGKIALVLGAEGEGLRRLTRENCDYLLRLPMTGAVESLNVSNAAAVALYELARGSL